jgi:hypothetical protein
MKMRKILSIIVGAVMCLSVIATNTFAVNENVDEVSSISAEDSSDIVQLDVSAWSDNKKVSWKEGNTTATHTMTCRLNAVYVYASSKKTYSKYTNHNGTYTNVVVYDAAPQTLFMSADVQRSSTLGSYSDYTDPVTGETTPRRLTEEDCTNRKIKIVCNSTSTQVIDMWADNNPLIYNHWSTVTAVE